MYTFVEFVRRNISGYFFSLNAGVEKYWRAQERESTVSTK